MLLQDPAYVRQDVLDDRKDKKSIDSVFDPELFKENAQLVVEKLEKHLSDKSIKGLKMESPLILLDKVKELITHIGDPSHSQQKKLSAILDLYIDTGIQVQSVGYMGRQFSSVIPLAAIFDFASSTLNQPASFYEAAQMPNVVEKIMADELNQFIGWPAGQFAMITTSGGSLANMTAILAARNDKFPDFWAKGAPAKPDVRPAIAVGADSHYSVCRAAGVLGIGEEQIVRLPLTAEKKIDPSAVPSILEASKRKGLNVFCLVASAGTTSLGTFDQLDKLARITKKNDIWLHVDGSHGASLLVSDRYRSKLKGIEQVDSFTWDAHKMMFMPTMNTLLFYKNKPKSYGAFRQDASYVFEKQRDIYSEFESAEQNFECTKRPMIMNLWVAWMMYGKDLFSDKIEYLCDLAFNTYQTLKLEKDFEPIHQPESNIMCFRYLPEQLPHGLSLGNLQLSIRNRLRKEGRFFISKVDIDGVCALRVVFMNHKIELNHFHLLLDEIREIAQKIINSSN